MKTKSYITHDEARDQSRELLRHNLVDASSHILMSEGPDALTVRRIADELDCSTKVIYTMFGGKEGLANELYLEGCSRLSAALESVPLQSDPVEHLKALGWAYWDFAYNNPAYYAVMFSRAIPHFKPSEANLNNMKTALKIMVEVLENYRQQGRLDVQDTVFAMKQLWAPLHGVVSLYQSGHFSDDEARLLFENTVEIVIKAVFQ